MEKHPKRRYWLGEGSRGQSRLLVKYDDEKSGAGATELDN